MKKIMMVVIFSLCFIGFKVNALDFCSESESHKLWASLSEEEKRKVIEPKYCEEESVNYDYYGLVGASNSKYSSLDLGLVTSVKNQGNTNACWAFSGISLLESAAIKSGMDELDLSERHVNMMSTYQAYLNNEVNKSGYNRNSNDGGNYSYVASYLFRGDGPILESSFPYVTPWYINYSKIAKSSMPEINPLLTADEYLSDYTSDTCTTDRLNTIKAYIREYGVVGVLINSSTGVSTGGDLYYINTTNTNSDHAVALVGYDDSISKNNFPGATRDGAFLVKNSWGTNFGNKGFYYISYDDIRICRSVVGFKNVSVMEYDHVYNASDTLGNTSMRSYGDTMVSTKLNINDTQVLDKVSFEVIKNTAYEVYLSKNNDLNDSSSWTFLGSGNTKTDGVISVKTNVVLTGSASIIVKFKTPGYVIPLMCKSTTASDKHYYMEISSGVNYYNVGSGWVDLKTAGSGTLVSCEPVIYAYTYKANKVCGSIDKVYLSSSSNKVYVNTSDYFNVDFTASNLKSNSLIGIDILKNGISEKMNFVIDKSKINNNYYKITPTSNATSGSYQVVLKYGTSEKRISFEIYDRIMSDVFTISGEYIKILPKKNLSITKDYVINNIKSESSVEVKRNDTTLVDAEIKTGDKLVANGKTYTIIIIGDANLDGHITPLDYIRIKNHILGNRVISDDVNLVSADANEDGSITPLDYIRIKNRILKGEV